RYAEEMRIELESVVQPSRTQAVELARCVDVFVVMGRVEPPTVGERFASTSTGREKVPVRIEIAHTAGKPASCADDRDRLTCLGLLRGQPSLQLVDCRDRLLENFIALHGCFL